MDRALETFRQAADQRPPTCTARSAPRPRAEDVRPVPLGPRLPRIAGLAALDPRVRDDPAARRSSASGSPATSSPKGIFDRCGVERRASWNLDDEFLASSLQGRTAQRRAGAAATRRSRPIDRLDIDRRTIGTVLTSSLYSLGCPSLAHRLIEHYGLDPATDKYHVTGRRLRERRAAAAPRRLRSCTRNPSREVLVRRGREHELGPDALAR